MKRPNLPQKPTAPYPVYAPKKEMETYDIIKEVNPTCDVHYTWEELQNLFLGELSPQTIEEASFEFICGEGYCSINVSEKKMIPNQFYDESKKRYDKDKIKYDKQMEIYEVKLTEYEIKMKQYKIDFDAWELEKAKKTIERLEKKESK